MFVKCLHACPLCVHIALWWLMCDVMLEWSDGPTGMELRLTGILSLGQMGKDAFVQEVVK